MNKNEINEIIVVKDNKLLTNKEKLNNVLKDVDTLKSSIEDFETTLRTKCIEAMMKTGETKLELNDYNISLVLGKSEEVFDENKFLENEDDEIINTFIKFEDIETFDLEKFKNENPDLYKKYCNVEEKYTIDTKNMSKLRPDVYNKYVTYKASTRKPTVMIKEKKEK